MKRKILVAEDDLDILNLIRLYLESSNFQVFTTHNGEQAWQIVQSEKIDLAILDVMMPKMDGFTLTQKIRSSYHFPILLLTAKSDDMDKILGLNLGADDYLTKPFNPLELLARVNANLRRFYNLNSKYVENSSSVITHGELVLNLEQMSLQKNSMEIVLTPNEYKILSVMMKSPGRIYTKSQLCEVINGEYYENYENAIMVHISHLREKIEDDPKNPRYIKNIRGVGYKIEKV